MAECGIFHVGTRSGIIRPLRLQDNPNCRYALAFGSLSVSPDGTRVLAREGSAKEVEMIDLGTGTFKPVNNGLYASWSPDGKLIAILSANSQRFEVNLLNPSGPSTVRLLGSTDAQTMAWSPDSHYLLLWRQEPACALAVGYLGTFQALDVKTGQRVLIGSSRCRVNLMTGGWVSNAVWK